MNKPKVSVCVAYYNRSDRILESIGSLLAQDYDDFEVVVVNDGSPDPLVKEYLDAFDDPRLSVIHQNNTGFVGAMHRAIGSSTGKYIAIHGAGDISLPERLTKQAHFLDTNQDYCLVSSHYSDFVVDEDGQDALQRSEFKIATGEVVADDLTYGPSPIGHGEIMYRRSAYDAAGGYRPFFKFAQDKDLWLRMIHFGRFYILPENLYDRGLFLKDGVAVNHEKLYLQKLLMAFAVQCYEYKLENGFDLIDKFGNNAGFFKKKSKKVAVFCRITALRAMIADDIVKANRFIDLSLQEKVLPKTLLIYLLIWFCQNSTVKKIILKVLKSLKRVKATFKR
ncbi:glycosyltransferase family 2 protein [Paraglaciecola chathamensis]|uniref:glycosyltransferase family 2 protein n=1 Tax=Paraglaciecola chathamensis TaxID=368405 RepID=UPI00270C7332|nr:glycosyltransferase family 2 protein [Paraglaciecola chathamensis]MDO6838787.1 glycosyltransferase family 2 protein [Paraglaciecola chathamensis]